MRNGLSFGIALLLLATVAGGCRRPAAELVPHENMPNGVVSAFLETLKQGDLEGMLSLMPGNRLENHRNAMKKSAEYREQLAPTLIEQLHGDLYREMKKHPKTTLQIKQGSESALVDVLLEYSDGSRRMAFCKAVLTRDGTWKVEETSLKLW